MNPQPILDMSLASATLQQVGAAAAPLFGSTIGPSAFILGIEIGGVIVAVLIGAVLASVGYLAGGKMQRFRDDSQDDYYIKGDGRNLPRPTFWNS